MAKFVEQVGVLPRLIHALASHPEGLEVKALADEVGLLEDRVRVVLRAYYRADYHTYVPDLVWRPAMIEFFGGSEDTDEISEAPMVRLINEEPDRELGFSYVPIADLARMYRAGRHQLQLEPDNEILRSALDKLADGVLPSVVSDSRPDTMTRPPEFHRAVQERHAVRITYTRAWRPGITDRVIEPYQMLRTRRGWEIDAGPLDHDGLIRTFLLTNVITFDVLEQTFTPPGDLPGLLERQRSSTAVEIRVPYDKRWAVEKYAEQVAVVEDEMTQCLRAELLEPVRHRVGLILLAAGPGAACLHPPALAAAGAELARELLAHHA